MCFALAHKTRPDPQSRIHENLHRELSSDIDVNEELEGAKRAVREQFEISIEKPDSKFTKDEVPVLNLKLDDLYSKFKDLSDKHQISEGELEKLHVDIERMKNSASTYKKGLWAKVTQNKITDLIFSLLKSKEGRDLIFDPIKRIGT